MDPRKMEIVEEVVDMDEASKTDEVLDEADVDEEDDDEPEDVTD